MLFSHADKVAHAVIFGGLAALTAWGLYRVLSHWPLSRVLLLAVLFTTIYGAIDEAHQWFVPGRQSDVLDLCADLLGASVAAWWLSYPLGRRLLGVAADR